MNEYEDDDRGGRDQYDDDRPRADVSAAQAKVKTPALMLKLSAAVMILFSLLGIGMAASGTDFQVMMLEQMRGIMPKDDKRAMEDFDKKLDEAKNRDRSAEMVVGLGQGVVQLGGSVLVLIAAMRMGALRSWGLSLTGAILAMIPLNGCCCLGLPFGLWAIIVLSNSDVKAAFQAVARSR